MTWHFVYSGFGLILNGVTVISHFGKLQVIVRLIIEKVAGDRKMIGSFAPYKILESETPVSEFIPYSHHITDSIISTKNAEYLSVWRIGGRSHQSASQQDVFL